MSSSEKFCLRWNDFESNISVAFRELREEKDFFDVTLACDDSQIQAHKVILSACSPFFRNVLRRNPHQHPLLYLKGVKYSELMSVLNFMYMGEVNVAQEELNSFLSVAEDLRVKGLTQNNSDSSTKLLPKQDPPKQTILRRDPPERDAPVIPPPKRPRPIATTPQILNPAPVPRSSYQQDDDDIQEVVPVKSEPRDPPPPVHPLPPVESQQVVYQEEQGMVEEHDQGTVALDDSYADESYDYGQYGEGYDDGSGLMDPNSGMAMGGDGNKVRSTTKFANALLEPAIQIHPGDLSMDAFDCYADTSKDWDREVSIRMVKQDNIYLCEECPYTSKNKTSVVSHIQGKHLEDFCGYMCKMCGSNSGTYCGFEKHMSRQHSFSLAKKNILSKASFNPSVTYLNQ